jgi:metal-dependent amidase/aminoacylase/carboxypeptidase family protein
MSTVLDPAIALSPEVKALNDEVVALRRDFHAHPELLFDLPYTSCKGRRVPARRSAASRCARASASPGVVALIDSGKPGRTVLYRADMDALPLLEETGAPYASQTKG